MMLYRTRLDKNEQASALLLLSASPTSDNKIHFQKLLWCLGTDLLVHKSRYPLDPSPPRQSPDGWLGDALDVVPEHLPVTLGPALAQPLATLAPSVSVPAHPRSLGHQSIFTNV